jgi:EEF1A lysine methyltransferase 2
VRQIRFGEDSVEKMVDWTVENCPPSAENPPFILDIGSGNGFLLFSLAEAGYQPSALCGIDYSPDATRLATLISESRSAREISFKACNFLSEDVPSLPGMSGEHPCVWDLLLDKGTYDAIALGTKDENGRSPAEAYPERAIRLIKPGGFFLITCELFFFLSFMEGHSVCVAACNFTEEELKAAFATPSTGLEYQSVITYPN